MRTSLIFIAWASMSFGQQAERTLFFRNLQSTAAFAEAGTVIRSIGEIRDLRVDASDKSIKLSGDPGQAALADWLFPKLDRPMEDRVFPAQGDLDFRPTQETDDMVRVLYFRHSKAPETIQRMATLIRSLTEIRRAFVSLAAGAFVVRGTQDQIETARWLMDALDRAALVTGPLEYRMAATGENTIGLLPAPAVASPEELKDIASKLILTVQVKRVFTWPPLGVIAMRSTPGKIQEAATALAQRLQ